MDGGTTALFTFDKARDSTILVQCIWGCKWVNPPQIATELISSPFVPDMSPT